MPPSIVLVLSLTNALFADISIESLFGQYCSGNVFAHDIKVNNLVKQNGQRVVDEPDTQRQESCPSSVPPLADQVSPRISHALESREVNLFTERDISYLNKASDVSFGDKRDDTNTEKPTKSREEHAEDTSVFVQEWLSQCRTENDENDSQNTTTSLTSVLSMRHSSTRLDAYQRMLQNCRGTEWNSIELISTGCNHSAVEQEL